MQLVIHLPSKFEASAEYDPQDGKLVISPRIFPFSIYITREQSGEIIDSYRVMASRSLKTKTRFSVIPKEKDVLVIGEEKPKALPANVKPDAVKDDRE